TGSGRAASSAPRGCCAGSAGGGAGTRPRRPRLFFFTSARAAGGGASATWLPMLYVMYCVAGVGAAFVYSCSIGSALKWFQGRRGLAAGIIAAGYGGGTA